MKFYEATNGYNGFSYARCYVMANDDKEALKLAKESFYEDGKHRTEEGHQNYWENVKIELLFDSVTDEPSATEIWD